MEIIVFGLILFIVGVSSTFLYDKYKDQIPVFKQSILEKIDKSLNKRSSNKRTAKKLHSKIDKDIDQTKKEIQKLKKQIKQTKLPKVKAGIVRDGDMPSEPEYYTVEELKQVIFEKAREEIKRRAKK